MGFFRKIYDQVIGRIGGPLDAQADRLGIKDGAQRNAFSHALQSAQMTYEGSPFVAFLGDLKEEVQ
jgi:hypothetical protein